MVPWWVPDLVREIRFLVSPPAGCPWGAIVLVWCFVSAASFTAGVLVGALIFSSGCRRFTGSVLRYCLAQLGPSLVIVWLSIGNSV